MKTGDKIKFKESEQEVIKNLSGEVQCARRLAEFASEQLKSSNDNLWDCVRELAPESKDHLLSINHKNHSIIVVREKFDYEKEEVNG